MEDYGALILRVFESGRNDDAANLFQAFIQSAFPTFHFRKLEMTDFSRQDFLMHGKSLNHVFEIRKTRLDGSPVWQVLCHRVNLGKTPDKHVYLDYTTLGFVSYIEKE